MTVYVSQDAVQIGLKWYPNDPVNLTFRVNDVDWSGTYTATVRQNIDTSSATVCTFNVSAVYDSINKYTTFTFTTSTQVPSGSYWWSCKQANGVTRFAGQVFVDV